MSLSWLAPHLPAKKAPQMCSSLSGTPLSQPGTPTQGTILHHSELCTACRSCSPTRLGSWDKGELSGNWRTSAMQAGEELWDSAGWGGLGLGRSWGFGRYPH